MAIHPASTMMPMFLAVELGVEHRSGEVHPPRLRAVGEGSFQGAGVGLPILRRGVDIFGPFQVRDGPIERGPIRRNVMADDDGTRRGPNVLRPSL